MAGNSAENGRSVTSKVSAILLAFTTGSTHSLTEIARAASLPLATAHRLTTELAATGLLERAEDGQYRVGELLKTLGSHAFYPPVTIVERARRVMEDLSSAVNRVDVRLGVLAGLDVAYIEKAAGDRLAPASFAATTLPAHATAIGKALVAFSPPAVADAIVARGLSRYTPFTNTSPAVFRRSLATIRLNRVAVSRRELDLDMVAVAVPVFGAGGAVAAALELLGRERNDVRAIRLPLIVAARTLSRDLAQQGWQGLPPT